VLAAWKGTDPDLPALKPAPADDANPVLQKARDLLADVQGELLKGVEVLEGPGIWRPFQGTAVQSPELTYVRAEGRVVRAYFGDWRAITIATAADLLGQGWPALRRCENERCRVRFLPKEPRQRFHDRKCNQRARSRRFARDHQQEKVRRVLRNGPGRGRGRKQR
jgi:hypothetical protein